MSRLGWTWDEVVAWHAATVARYTREVAAGPRASGRQYACYMEFAEMRAITCQGLPEVPFWRPAEAENKKAETKDTGTQTADAKEEKKTADAKEEKAVDAKEEKVQCPVSLEFLEKKWGTHQLLAPEDWHLWS